MSEEKSFHMSAEEFRRQGHAVVDWIADYHSRVEEFPVLCGAQPGEIRAQLPANAPQRGESFEQIVGERLTFLREGYFHKFEKAFRLAGLEICPLRWKPQGNQRRRDFRWWTKCRWRKPKPVTSSRSQA